MGTYFTDLVDGLSSPVNAATFNAVFDEIDTQLIAQQAAIDGFSGGELGSPSELTIASGEITVTGGNHTVDTESDASSDDLDTINGLGVGEMLFISAANAARTVVVKHAVGNIRLNGGVDFDLDNTEKGLLFVGTASYVIGVGVPVTAGAGSGTVTSVALTVPSVLTVSGSPVTTSGTLAVTFASGQTANRVLASPDGSTGAVSLRALVSDDLPTVAINKGGTGQTTQTAGFDALAPTTTEGDLIVRGASNNGRLAVGSEDDVLTIVSGVPAWAAASGGGGDVVTGSYVGNATDPRTITTGSDGKTPKMVIVTRESSGVSLVRFGGGPCVSLVDSSIPGWSANQIQSLVTNGFTIGSGTPNVSAATYHWVAFYGS